MTFFPHNVKKDQNCCRQKVDSNSKIFTCWERVKDEHSRILYRLIHVCSPCDSDDDGAAAGATAVSYHACSGEGVALRRVSEAVAALARTEVEAAARAPESSVAVLCLQATESSRVCAVRSGARSQLHQPLEAQWWILRLGQ